MSEAQLLVSHLVKLGLLALLVGMLRRGRLAACWTFGLYVLAILVGDSLTTLAPERFFTHSLWMLKQGTYDLLKVAIAVELAWRAFAALRNSTLKVALAWALKEATALWEYRYVGAARRFFRRWYYWATHSRLPPMIEKARMLKAHLTNILPIT